MDFPNIAKSLQVAFLALGISSSGQQLSAEVASDVSSLLDYQSAITQQGQKKCFPEINLGNYLQDYTVVSGDTLGLIAQKNAFNPSHLINYWTELYPGKNPNNLKIGENIKIFTPNYIDAYLQAETVLIAKKSYEKIISAWKSGDIDFLEKNFSYSITPERPISQGYKQVMDGLGEIWMHNIRGNAPANVDSRFIHEAVCAHQARRWDKFSINPNDPNIPLKLRQLVMEFFLDAWMFADKYVETGLFTIPEKYDWRTLFSKRFSKGVNPIDSEKREEYNTGMLEMLALFKKQGIPGTKIPTKFLFTNAQASISSYNGGINQASHVITYVGEYTSLPFKASEYKPMVPISGFDFTGNKSVELGDFLTYLVQDQTDMFYILSQDNHKIIKNRLPALAPYIDLWVNDEKINILEALQNGNFKIHGDDSIKIGGSLAMDGFHLYTSPNKQESSEMTTRLRPLWVHLASGVMYPANIIEPTQELQNIGKAGEHEEILSKIKIRAYVSLRPPIYKTNSKGEVIKINGKPIILVAGEDAKGKINDFLAVENYGLNYNSLSGDEKKYIDDLYILQSLGHQLYGNQNFGGTKWNSGTYASQNSFPEESTTFSHRPIQIFDESNIQEVYNQYIRKKELEYDASFSGSYCEDMNIPFVYLKAFPGNNKYTLMYRLGTQLERVDPKLGAGFKNLPFIEKEKFIINVLGEDIYNGNIESGKNFFLDKLLIENIITFQNLQSPQAPKLGDKNGFESPDQKIIDTIAENETEKYMLSWALIIESYVDSCENCSDFDKKYVWNLFQNELFSRRAVKDHVHNAELFGVQDFFDAQGKDFWDKFPDEGVKKLQDVGILDSNYKMVRVTSLADFQVRVLYNMNNVNSQYLDSWPGKYLEVVIDSILDQNGKYEILLGGYSKFQYQINIDLEILREIKKLLLSDTERNQGGEIEKLIRKISLLDTGNQKNIIGKIFWGELLRYKNKEHSENLFQQLQVSKQAITNIENISERFILGTQIISNLGEKKSSYLFLENYLQRLIKTLKPDITLPVVKNTEGIMSQTDYDVSIFNEHLYIYENIVNGMDTSLLSEEEKNILSSSIIEIKRSFSKSEEIYEFFANSEISKMYESRNLDPYMLPRVTEFDNYDIFRYTAQKKGLAEKRVHKPEFSSDDVVIPIIAGSIAAQSFLSMLAAQFGLGFTITGRIFKAFGIYIKRRTKKLIKDNKKYRENYTIGKAKKVLFNSIKNIKNESIDTYIDSNKLKESLILNSESLDYRNEYFKKTPEDGIVKRKIYPEALLTNEQGHPLAPQYHDGKYEFIDSVTRIINDHNKKAIELLIRKQENILLLTPEQRIFPQRQSIAAAE